MWWWWTWWWLRKRENSSSESSPSKSEPEWCSLETDILEEITNRLETRIDILRLRSVCKGWRSSIPFPPIHINVLPFNLQLPPQTKYIWGAGKTRLLLKESTLCSLQLKETIKKSWFVNKIEHTDSGKVLLKDPFPTLTINTDDQNGQYNVVNLSNYKVRELRKEYCLDFVPDDKREPRDEEIMELVHLRKVIVGENERGKIVVMTIHDVTGKVQVWKMGEKRWVVIDRWRGYQDIIYHKRRFYAVDYRGRTIAVEYSSSSLKTAQVARGIFERPLDTTSFLAKSQDDDLYLIIKKYGFGCLDVFKLDEKLGQWIPFSEWLMEGLRLKDGRFHDGEFGGCNDKYCFYFRYFDYLAWLTFQTPTSESDCWD